MKTNKTMMLSVTMILLASLLLGAGTFAAFSDTETSTGNTFTAGTLDLRVGGSTFEDDPNVASVTLSDVKPGDTIYLYWTLKNVGTISGQPSIEFANIVNYENEILEPESAAGDTSSDVGELGKLLYVMVKWRQDSGAWHTIVGKTTIRLNYLKGPYVGIGVDRIPILGLNEQVEIELRLWWDGRYNTPGDNIAQSDSVTFDIIFHLDQVT